jgi:glycerol-3-phosphate dehydrogenase
LGFAAIKDTDMMQRNFDALNNSFDLLVIGGGIYGAWTAYDAALRGLKVALVEKKDWGSGTSQSSSKLIHGGLRYLEHGWFGLVRKSLQERKRLLRLAPHRISPLCFLLPIYEDSRLKRWALKIGLSLYDLLAPSDFRMRKHRFLSKEEVLTTLPFLSGKKMLGGFEFFDAQTDDARCTLEIVWGALQANAVCVNHTEVTHLLRVKDRVCGVLVKDSETGKTLEIQSKITVNTAGPWCEHLEKTENETRRFTRLTRGAHLVMPLLSKDRAMLLSTRLDRRVFFLLPWYGATLLGTTDTDYYGNPNDLNDCVSAEETTYLLEEANRYLDVPWSAKDILGSFVGLRALKRGSKPPSSISREWILEEPEKNFLLSLGGKFTSARMDAAQIVDRVSKMLGISSSHPTEERPFPWCPKVNFQEWKQEKIQEGISLGLDAETAHHACHRFGSTVDLLFSLIRKDPALANRIVPEHPFCQGEVKHAALHEMARTSEDIFRRRIPLSILSKINLEKHEPFGAL